MCVCVSMCLLCKHGSLSISNFRWEESQLVVGKVEVLKARKAKQTEKREQRHYARQLVYGLMLKNISAYIRRK